MNKIQLKYENYKKLWHWDYFGYYLGATNEIRITAKNI